MPPPPVVELEVVLSLDEPPLEVDSPPIPLDELETVSVELDPAG
jgi:hypothetical protein